MLYKHCSTSLLWPMQNFQKSSGRSKNFLYQVPNFNFNLPSQWAHWYQPTLIILFHYSKITSSIIVAQNWTLTINQKWWTGNLQCSRHSWCKSKSKLNIQTSIVMETLLCTFCPDPSVIQTIKDLTMHAIWEINMRKTSKRCIACMWISPTVDSKSDTLKT